MTKTPMLSRRALLTGSAAAVAAAAVGTTAHAASAETVTGRFANKVVLITGATSGIGRVTAEHFAREGATVVFNGRREALGRQVEAGISASGGKAQ